MTATRTPEYRKLGLESSNDLIRHDARRGDGRYADAARHAREAGFARLRMGQMMFDAGEFVHATADWLSAAACFYLVPDLKRMRDTFERTRLLVQDKGVPPTRRDITAALTERAEQIAALEQKLARFDRDAAALAPDQPALDWLVRQVRELPGLPRLHAEIATHADRLGHPALAAEHREWAEKFERQDARLEANDATRPADPERARQPAPLCDAPSAP